MIKHKLLAVAALSLPVLASAATNLVANGSFESGLTGWTSTTTAGTTYPVSVITYGPGAAFGETVLPDSSSSLSPDAAGTKAVYFVDDKATQTLSQSFSIATAGNYMVGFSTYAPANGASNAGNASFSAVIAGNTVSSVNVSSLAVATWQSTAGTIFIAAPGSYTVNFTFATTGGVSKDLVIDRVYVIAAVPEPGTYALMLAGLAAIGFVARRRPRG